jgi:hypothetical protein
VKVIGRRIGAQSDTKMLLYFVEKVAGKNAFPKWIHKERFSPAQKERLRNFMEAFHRDVKIMDYADPSA